ncbi:MAG: CDP-glycerol glycerophosphotransferase family protein [Candidatus Roizmanbacteria bacterium]|nr:CDP-glycerol glycerophosphotransferase family protein [Candidatus Roizmanbacteria bacterium]
MNIFNSICTGISELLHLVLYWLACTIPKHPNTWSVGAWYGKTYNDNSKYLFEYVSHYEKHINIAWITKDKKVKAYIRSKGYRAYLTYEPFGIFHMLTSSIALFVQTKEHDLSGSCIGPKTKLVQLWHGFSFKKYLGTNPIRMPFQMKVHPLVEKSILSLALVFLHKKYNSLNDLPYRNEYWEEYHLICAKSARHKQKFLDIVPTIKPEKIVVAEYPRTDGLLDTHYSSPFVHKIEKLKAEGARIGIFMPTFRSSGCSVPDVYLPGIEKFSKYLEKNNIHIFVKLHSNDASSFIENCVQYKAFHLISNNDIHWDIYPVLSHTDFLLTDYSSIYSDYALLDKPIIFTPFDKDEYQKFRGLYSDYDRLTEGKSAVNWNQVEQLLAQIKPNNTKIMPENITSYSKEMFSIITGTL